MSVFGGIVEKTGSGGSAGAWQKNNTDRIKAACVGSGASGFRDNDGDEDGGGGGGGGRAAGVTNINVGETISWKQGNKSPQQSSGKGGTNGSNSYVRRANGANIALATGGKTGTDDSVVEVVVMVLAILLLKMEVLVLTTMMVEMVVMQRVVVNVETIKVDKVLLFLGVVITQILDVLDVLEAEMVQHMVAVVLVMKMMELLVLVVKDTLVGHGIGQILKLVQSRSQINLMRIQQLVAISKVIQVTKFQ